MPKKETKILLAVFLLLGIASMGAFVFLFSFTKNLIAESVNKSNDIKTELKKEGAETLMKDDLILGEMYQKKLEEYIIAKGGTVDFLKTLEQLISNTGLKYNINTVSSATYDKGDKMGEELLKININATGAWQNIQLFLKSLENYPLKINITKMSLNKFSDSIIKGRKVPEWSLNLDFTVVKMKDK